MKFTVKFTAKWPALAIALFLPLSARADFKFSPGLTQGDRSAILKTLGLGTQSKNLSTPEPLGTESGFELAFMTEMINTKKIKPFIADSNGSGDVLYYPKILIGKGLYKTTDFFFHFVPFTSTLGISEFGGMFRQNLYRSEGSPLNVSGMIHANSANFNNQLITRNVGVDLSTGLTFRWFSVFGGVGWASSKGKFVGGTSGTTDTGLDESEDVESVHLSAGTLVRYEVMTFGLSFDRYAESVYTAKVGVLF